MYASQLCIRFYFKFTDNEHFETKIDTRVIDSLSGLYAIPQPDSIRGDTTFLICYSITGIPGKKT